MANTMKFGWRKKIVGVVLLSLMILLLWLFGRFADWYKIDFLVYQGNYYLITYEPIKPEECGDYIGEILHQTPMRAILGNEDFDSNKLPSGTKIYATKDPVDSLSNNKLIVSYNGYYAAYRIYDSPPFPN